MIDAEQWKQLLREASHPGTIELQAIDPGDGSIDLLVLPPPQARPEQPTVILDLGACATRLTVHTWVGRQVQWRGQLIDVEAPQVQVWIPPEAGELPVQFGRPKLVAEAVVRPPLEQLPKGWTPVEELDEVACRLDKASVFIEMGQGIISDRLEVMSSQLWSCCFIVGINRATGLAGAYHYPAASLHDPHVWLDMNAWRDALHPTQAILLKPAYGAETDTGTWTAKADLDALAAWLQHDGAQLEIRSASRPWMRSDGRQFLAGDADAKGLGDADHILSACRAGDYADKKERLLRLIGSDMTSRR